MSTINHPSEHSTHSAGVPPEAHQRANFPHLEAIPQVIAQRIADKERLMFLPRFLEQHACRFETLVYLWMHRLVKNYEGGYWEFYTLSNGGFYMTISEQVVFEVIGNGNGFHGAMSSEASLHCGSNICSA